MTKYYSLRQYGNMYANHPFTRSGQYLQSREERGTSVDQIERFYSRNLSLSKEMAVNFQSFGSG